MRGEESGDQGGRGTMLRVDQRGELDGTGVRRRKQSQEGRVKWDSTERVALMPLYIRGRDA